MKQVFLFLLIVFFMSCQRNNSNVTNVKVIDDFVPPFTVEQITAKLELSFRQVNYDSIGQIFINWNLAVKPNSDQFIRQNDTIYALFTVFKEFYKPLDLLKLGRWEWGNKLNSNCIYVAVQNKIFYSVLPKDSLDGFEWGKLKRDSLENFRPPIALSENTVLYLTDEYEKSINQFLGTESTELGERNIMNPSRPKGESEKRYEILRQYLPILHGHWGGYWHLQTHPFVNIIIFNKTLTKAKISFRLGYQGGEAILEKVGDEWKIKERKATWIE